MARSGHRPRLRRGRDPVACAGCKGRGRDRLCGALRADRLSVKLPNYDDKAKRPGGAAGPASAGQQSYCRGWCGGSVGARAGGVRGEHRGASEPRRPMPPVTGDDVDRLRDQERRVGTHRGDAPGPLSGPRRDRHGDQLRAAAARRLEWSIHDGWRWWLCRHNTECGAQLRSRTGSARTRVCHGRIPDFPVTRSHPLASWPSAANSSIGRTYRKTVGEESLQRSPVASR